MANLRHFEEQLRLILAGQVNPDLVRTIEKICYSVEGMCNEQTLAMLNMAVTECLNEDETYLEVGTWMGRCVITALQNNNARALVIDPLTFDDSTVAFPRNIKLYDLDDRIDFFQLPWQQYLQDGNTPEKIGIYFYDGDHGVKSSYDGLNAFLPFVSDEAILIVDDTCMQPVAEDMKRWIDEHKANIVFYYEVPFWMGQSVIGYRR